MTGNPNPTVLTGLIGRNITASRSPWLHESEARAQGFDLRYVLLDFAVTEKDERDLAQQLMQVQAQGFAGVNVTYPYKRSIIAHLDELSPGAARVGAVNTVKFSNGRRLGYNTDITGFAASVRSDLAEARLSNVLQFGAGGGGSATAFALLELGAQCLHVKDRDLACAEDLVERLQQEFGMDRARVCVEVMDVLATVDGIVNATPMGMANQPQAPFDTSQLQPAQWVADIVYFPLETTLLRDARRIGCATLDGSGMAVHQAAEAFEIFTGRKPNIPRMLQSFLQFASKARSEPT
jgi:shikimate dehydrogenase